MSLQKVAKRVVHSSWREGLTFEEDFKNLQKSKARTAFVVTQIYRKTFILTCYEANSKISRVLSVVALSEVSDQLV